MTIAFSQVGARVQSRITQKKFLYEPYQREFARVLNHWPVIFSRTLASRSGKRPQKQWRPYKRRPPKPQPPQVPPAPPIAPQRDPLEKFLLDVFGFDRVSQAFSQRRTSWREMQDIFLGTILGSWQMWTPSSSSSPGVEPIRKHTPWPTLPYILTTGELMVKGLGNRIQREDLEFHLVSQNLFYPQSRLGIVEFFFEKIYPVFPWADFSYQVYRGGRSFILECHSTNFGFRVAGNSTPKSNRGLTFDFSAPLELVRRVNQIVNQFRNTFPGTEDRFH